MRRALIQYGRPTEPDAFEEHYRTVHAPLAHKIPGLIRFEAGHAAPLGGDEAPYLLATLDFDSGEAFAAGLQSPEGAAAVADLQNLCHRRSAHEPVRDRAARRRLTHPRTSLPPG